MGSIKNDWDLVIKPKQGSVNINLSEIYRYRDLIYMFVKRDFVTFYKQTILGPLWYIIQPLVNTLVFTVIFGKVAKISTDGVPPFLFYMSGTVAWAYFSTCLNLTSSTFIQNSHIFGKVYFPRLSVPIAHILISLLQFLIQSIIFLIFFAYFYFNGAEINPTIYVFFVPLLVLQMALMSLGFGALISSLTTKYRDLSFAMSFLVQLWMFATPIVYPLSLVPEKYQLLAAINPMTSVVESFRLAFFGEASLTFTHVAISVLITTAVFFAGIANFNRVEKTFMDTI